MKNRTLKIGLLSSYHFGGDRFHFFYPIYRGIFDQAWSLNVNLYLYNGADSIQSLWESGEYRKFDGFLGIVSWADRNSHAAWCSIQKKKPCVALMNQPRNANCNLVSNDEIATLDLLVDHFHRQGIRDIAYFGVAIEGYGLARMRAFGAAMNKRKLPFTARQIFGFDPDTDHFSSELLSIKPFQEIAQAKRRYELFFQKYFGTRIPAACLFENDYLLEQFFQYATNRGIRIPQDMAVAGIDDRRLLWFESPPNFFTSVAQDYEGLGVASISLLCKMLAGKFPLSGQKIFLAPRLVVRKSSHLHTLEAPSTEFVNDVERFLNQHYSKSNAIGELATHYCLNRRYFLMKFKQETGVAFSDRLLDIRLQKAALLLVTSVIKITDLVYRVGFQNIQYFNRAFKKKYGATPSEYARREARNLIKSS